MRYATGGAKAKMIELKNLSKTFLKDGNRIEVLRGLNLKIAGVNLWRLLCSGAGKSTLIHILVRWITRQMALLYINDLNIFEWDEKTMARFRNATIGFVFQFNNLLPEFDALENIMDAGLNQWHVCQASFFQGNRAIGRAWLGAQNKA